MFLFSRPEGVEEGTAPNLRGNQSEDTSKRSARKAPRIHVGPWRRIASISESLFLKDDDLASSQTTEIPTRSRRPRTDTGW